VKFEINSSTSKVTIRFDDEKTNIEEIIERIEKKGFRVKKEPSQLKRQGR
jgi:copper chaperone CopZ